MIFIEINRRVIPLDYLIESELDVQFSKRRILEAIDRNHKDSLQCQLLRQDIEDSCKRVRHYYDLKDHRKPTINIMKP